MRFLMRLIDVLSFARIAEAKREADTAENRLRRAISQAPPLDEQLQDMIGAFRGDHR